MTTVRIIKEKIRLDACTGEMAVTVPYSPNASWKSIGSVILVKVKPLAKAGMVQIKFKTRYRNAVVQKADLPGSTMVEHERVATEADGPDAGVPMRAVAVHDGIVYQVIRPGDNAQKLVADAAARQRPRPMDPTIEDIMGGGIAGNMMAQILASASLLAGFEITPAHVTYSSPDAFLEVGRIFTAAQQRAARRDQGAQLGLQDIVDQVGDEVREIAQARIDAGSDGIWPGQ